MNWKRDLLPAAIACALLPAMLVAQEQSQQHAHAHEDPEEAAAGVHEHAGVMSEGHVLGPQPGPDHPLKTVENPFKGDVNAIKEGRRLFVWFNCSGCHGGRAGGGMGPSLRDAAWMYGNTHHDIYNSISEGRPHGMPAWGTKLPPDQIWKLTAYIKSMGTEKEPAKPPKNPVYPDPPPRRDVKGVKAGGADDGDEDKDDT